MALQYLKLQTPQYVPSYNTLNTDLVSSVAGSIAQQGQLAQEQYGVFQNLQEQAATGLTGLPEEYQSEALGLIDESKSRIDQAFEERGARNTLPFIQREAGRITQQLRPYQQVAQQSQAYKQRIDEVGEEKGVDSMVRRYLQSQGEVVRDESGKLGFRAPDTTLLDNWRDLHEIARETIKDVEANVEESPVHLQEGEDFYQRVKHKYRDFDKLEAVGVARLLSDRDAVRQMRLTLQANGIEFLDGIAHQRNSEGELEPVTVEENGKRYQMTEQEAIEQEAVRIVSPTAAARTMSEQTFTYTSQNPLYFSALENDGTSGGNFITYPVSTVAGVNPISNPVRLNKEIESTRNDYNQMLNALESQGIIQRTSEENGIPSYRVLKPEEYNSRKANLQGLRDKIQQSERRKQRIQTMAFREFYGDQVNEQNVSEFENRIRQQDQEFQQREEELRQIFTNSSEEMERLRYMNTAGGVEFEGINNYRELTDAIIAGARPEDFGLHKRLSDRQFNDVKDLFESLRRRYEKRTDSILNELSPAYQTYGELLKEDAKGRTVQVPVLYPTNKQVLETADTFMSRLIQPGTTRTSATDIKWLNTDRANKSIFEEGDDENISGYEFSGFGYHPDSGEPIAIYAALEGEGDSKKASGSVYVPATQSFKDLIPVNDEFAKESYYNNMINVAGSNPSREGKVSLILGDVEQIIGRPIDVEVEIRRPIKTTKNEGIPIVSSGEQDPEVELVIKRPNGTEKVETFATTNEALRRIKELEQNIRTQLTSENSGRQ